MTSKTLTASERQTIMLDGGLYKNGRMPHYSQTTVSHSAADFSNTEQDMIRQAFHTGNYTWMKELLPVELYPESVNFLRKKRMDHVRTAQSARQPMTWSKMTSLWGGGYYFEFEFMPDPYDAKRDHELSEKRKERSKWDDMGHPKDWKLPSCSQRLKHEPLVISKDELKDPRLKQSIPYLGPERSEEDSITKKSLNESSIQQPSFKTGKGAGLNDDGKMSRAGVHPQIVYHLQNKLNEDWDDVVVIVSVTDMDIVQIAFEMKTVDSERGVMAYMNILSKDCELINTLGLRKISQLWGVQRIFSNSTMSKNESMESNRDKFDDQEDSTWMFFLLCPKWVKMRNTDAFYTRHPRAHGSQFRMSQAGSSVLMSMGNSIADQSISSSRFPMSSVSRENTT